MGRFLEQHAAFQDFRALLEAHGRRCFVCLLEKGERERETEKLHKADCAVAEEIALVAEDFGFLDFAEVAGLSGVANLTARGGGLCDIGDSRDHTDLMREISRSDEFGS